MEAEKLIGKTLLRATLWLNPVFRFGEASKVMLEFPDASLVILPLVDTDEISIELHRGAKEREPGGQAILHELVGRKLGACWYCENNRGYFDLVVFGFDYLQPTFGILSEGSALKLVECRMAPTRPSDLKTG